MTDRHLFDPNAVDRVIHHPVRLGIMGILAADYIADFTFLRETLRITDGNLATHLRQLEDAGYVSVTKEFVGRRPRTTYSATDAGKAAYAGYVQLMSGFLGQKNPTGTPPWTDQQ